MKNKGEHDKNISLFWTITRPPSQKKLFSWGDQVKINICLQSTTALAAHPPKLEICDGQKAQPRPHRKPEVHATKSPPDPDRQ